MEWGGLSEFYLYWRTSSYQQQRRRKSKNQKPEHETEMLWQAEVSLTSLLIQLLIGSISRFGSSNLELAPQICFISEQLINIEFILILKKLKKPDANPNDQRAPKDKDQQRQQYSPNNSEESRPRPKRWNLDSNGSLFLIDQQGILHQWRRIFIRFILLKRDK